MTSIIWINSTLNATISSSQSGFITNVALYVLDIFKINISESFLTSWIRTGAHFGQFFVLGIFWGYYLLSIKKPMKYLLFAVIITAILDENIQIFSEGRAFEIFDIGIDGLGGLFSLLFFKTINKLEKI
jgi:VanZ family protein